MALPTYATALSQINTFIVANGNNEITANVLNPILKVILDFANNNIGDLATLTTDEKNSIVESINSLKEDFDNLVNKGIQLHTGIADPNLTPPTTYNYADFYMQLDVDDNPIALWQWNGFTWTSNMVPAESTTDDVINNSDIPGVTTTLALNFLFNRFDWKTPQDYGAVGDGVTDDSDAIIACMLDNDNVFLYGSYKITKDLSIKTGHYIFSNNATITRLSTSGVIFKALSVNNWTIGGNLTLVGNGKSSGSAKGIYIEYGENYKISNLTVRNISGNGLDFYGNSPVINRGQKGVLSNIALQNNWIGANWGTRAEYVTMTNVNANGNGIALNILAGNVNIIGGSISDNDNGIYLGGTISTNNSHGIFQGLAVNHNVGYNLKCENVEYGQSIVGCHFYAASPDLGINIVNSKGIVFDGCTIDGPFTNTDSNTPKGVHMLSNTLFESAFTPTGDPVVFKDCFTKTGGMFSGNNEVGRFTKTLTVIGGTTGITADIAGQVNGSITMGNAASLNAVPTISGNSGDRAGLTLNGTTANANTFGDINFVIRELANVDYSTLTTSAFKFNRFATTLIDVLRNGNTTFTGKVSSSVVPTASADLTNKNYVDTADALKANLASPALTGTPTAPTATAGTSTTQIATTAFVQASTRPYKVYTAIISQVSTSAPTVTVMENTIGAIVWTRSGVGTYLGTLVGAFTASKTLPFLSNNANVNNNIKELLTRTSADVVQLQTYSNTVLTDGTISNMTIEIRVFN